MRRGEVRQLTWPGSSDFRKRITWGQGLRGKVLGEDAPDADSTHAAHKKHLSNQEHMHIATFDLPQLAPRPYEVLSSTGLRVGEIPTLAFRSKD